MFLNNRRCL